MNISALFEQLIDGKSLTHTQMQGIMKDCMMGSLNDVQIATFLALMRMKGETVDELSTAAVTMQQMAHHINLNVEAIDIVGTGGDGKNLFNVSTVSSFVVAAAGVPVAKHGNRSVSSRSGSADLLLTAGFVLNLSDAAFKQCIEQCNIVFLFAPHFHQALQYVKNARQQLGIRTFFNLLGPLLNPAGVKKQVVGVFESSWLKPLAKVLANLGSERALVVNSQDGLDEISIAAPTQVMEYYQGQFKPWAINPRDYGCAHGSLEKLVVENPEQSLALAESIFSGKKGPARDIVLLNAAAALYCANAGLTFDLAVEQAANAIDTGAAGKCFLGLRDLTQLLRT